MNSKIKTESGIPIGNVYDKYATGNPIARALMRGFETNVMELARRTGAQDIHEVGCGEGHLTRMLLELQPQRMRGSDFSHEMVAVATQGLAEHNVSINQRNIYELSEEDGAELIVCCEVLEHLEQPLDALEKLSQLAGSFCIMSVPREPIWRALNMARGKYLGQLGNTPGHLQHWSSSAFVKMVSNYFDIVEVRRPLPWTMLLARPKS